MAPTVERRRITTRTTQTLGTDEVRNRIQNVADELAKVRENASMEVKALDNIRNMLDPSYITSLLATVEELSVRIEELETESLRAVSAQDSMAEDLENSERRLKELYEAYKLQEDELMALKENIPLLEKKIIEREITIEKLNREFGNLETLKKYRTEYEVAVKENHRLNDQLDQLESEAATRQKEIDRLRTDVTSLKALEADRKRVEDLERELERQESRLASLYQVSQGLEGKLAASTKELDTWRTWFRSVKGSMEGVCKGVQSAPQ